MDNKINRALFIVITAALIINLVFSDSVAAAENFKISAAKVEGIVGTQVTVNIMAEKASGSEGGQFTLTFDQSLVQPVLLEPGDLVLSAESNLHMANLEYAPGELIFMWVTVSADTKDSGLICRIIFDLLKEGTTAVGFKDLIVVDGSDELAKSTAGQIKIGPAGSGQEAGSGSGQESDSDQNDSSNDDVEGAGEEVIVEEVEEDDPVLIEERLGFNPFLVLIPIIIIIALAIFYNLVKKRGKGN